MSDPLAVSASETGIVRLFRLDMPAEQARFLAEPGAAAQALGVTELDPAQVEIIRVADLDEIGLAGFLTEGAGVAESEIAADRARLAALDGYVMVVFSRAFGGRALTLAPAKGVTLIGRYAVTPTDWTGGPIETESARPFSAMPQAPRKARAEARRIGGLIFAVFMVLILVAVAALVLP